MDKQIQMRKSEHELWTWMNTASWSLYLFAVVTFALIYLNVLPGITLVSVTISGKAITFGYPTLIFVLG